MNTTQAERISLDDGTLVAGWANHAQRYHFAARYCRDRRVLDAGCGTGYGSAILAASGAEHVIGVDIDADAITEAQRLYQRPNLEYRQGDTQRLYTMFDLPGPFGAIVSLEHVEHIRDLAGFMRGVMSLLVDTGTLVVSSPNGALTVRGADGRPANPWHVKEYTALELEAWLAPHFGQVQLWGQWATPDRVARIAYERRIHTDLCSLYFHPADRAWRAVRRLLGRPVAPPPVYSGDGTAYQGDYVIYMLDEPPFPWAPEVLLAVAHRD